MLAIADVTTPARVVISNVCGSLSLACWIILLLPQLLEQWRLKSADGLSISFITAWFLGDLANLVGAVWGSLRPNVILLALWFCFSDALLIVSYFYYSRIKEGDVRHHGARDPERADNDQTAPLLPVSSAGQTAHPTGWLLTTAAPMIFVVVVATVSYAISDQTPESGKNKEIGLGPEICGFISAAFYVLARVPQIIQNHRRRSVEGLSKGFFVLSIVGNLTYGAQILVYRDDADWIVSYAPWLIGSLGTILEDCVIFLQFYTYNVSA